MNIDFILQSHGLMGGKSKDKVPPPPITNFQAEGGNGSVILTWDNPIDTDFIGVRIQRKTGDYPTSPTDGTTIFNGVATTFTDTSVTNDVTYYYRAFTYDYDNNFNDATSQQVTGTPESYKVYGVAIDLTNSNPQTSVTYTDSAVNMTAGSSWDNVYPFNAIKPVLLNVSGVETTELNPNNFSQTKDGGSANITSGDNVMIKIPKVWYKIETIGNVLYIKISDVQFDSDYKCYGHNDGTTERDAFYVGAYLGFNQSNVLKSWSGKAPTANVSLENFRTYARANGSRYNLLGFYQLTVLQILQLIRSKNLDSQAFYGQGYTSTTSVRNTGGRNSVGLYTSDASTAGQVKIMGIEDFYGNLLYCIDGIKTNASRNLLTTKNPSDFNNNAVGYDTYATGLTSSVVGYMSKPQGTTEMGFVAKEAGGSATTYFTDSANLDASYFVHFGGDRLGGTGMGAFSLRVISDGTYSPTVGARLMYL